MDAADPTIELRCPGCGYDLHGISSPRCPECGISLDWAKLAESRIPWDHRRNLGRAQAFFKTVWRVVFHPGATGQDVVRPVNYHDAQKFRWVVVISACIPLWAWVLAGQIVWGYSPPGVPLVQPNLARMDPLDVPLDLLICFYGGATIWPVPWLAVLLLVAGVSGAGSYLFHPRGIPVVRQDRAIALSLYSSAPLVMILVPSILFGVLMILHRLKLIDDSRQLSAGMGTLLFLAWISLALVPILLWYDTLRILRVATTCSWPRVLAGAVALPLVWLLLAGLTLALVPAIFGFIRMVVYSYWL